MKRAGLLDRVDLRVGPAAETLANWSPNPRAPFDLIFIDADKAGYPEYLELSLKLSRAGTVIVADNVVRDGKVIEPQNPDPNIQGVRRFTELWPPSRASAQRCCRPSAARAMTALRWPSFCLKSAGFAIANCNLYEIGQLQIITMKALFVRVSSARLYILALIGG